MRASALGISVLVGALSIVAVAACASTSGSDEPSCSVAPIDKLKELIVVDEALLRDPRSLNGRAGPWSFRYVIENISPEGGDDGAFVRAWLEEWANVKEVNGSQLDRVGETREGEMRRRVICPWLRRTPGNNCDESCSCTSEKLDLATAPFRLIAIANRVDLHTEIADEPAGEGRFVFALTEGAGDDPASRPLPMTVVVEYALPETRSVKQWAESWHALGRFATTDEPYRVELEALTRSYAARGARPGALNGSALAQIRTNESALNWIWQLREFSLVAGGKLKLRPTRNTPIAALNNTVALRDHVLANRDAILQKTYEMPVLMRTGAADQLLYVWAIPGVDEPLRKAFAAGTCNGCHSTENPNVDTAFHVSPFREGVHRLSPFLYDERGGPDELSVRAASLQRVLCRP